MLDKYTTRLIATPLNRCSSILYKLNISANSITVTGFIIGMMAIPLISIHYYYPALCCIILNRIFDGLDGALARLSQPTDAGGYLDITLDFLFYSGVVLGFSLADPTENSLAASILLYSFVGTGSTFLAFGIMAEKRGKKNSNFPTKGFYYFGGLAEGTETIFIIVLFCLFPQYFNQLAYIFASICFLSTAIRIIGGYNTLVKNR